MFYLLPLTKTIKLKNEFKADCIAIFQSATLNLTPLVGGAVDNTSINLLSATDDILLTISFRRFQNAIAFNTMPAGGSWGGEERVPLQGAFVGPDNSITVYDHGDRFQILIDYHTVLYYNKRINKNATSFSYGTNSGQASESPFSDPLAVYAYDSLAGLAAGGN